MHETMDKITQTGSNNSALLILGAGASIGAAKYPIESSWRGSFSAMPSGENFFYDLFLQGKNRAHGTRHVNMLGLTNEGLNNLIIRGWALDKNIERFDPDEWKQLNIEEVFTFLDIGSGMYPRGTEYYRAFREFKESLTAFITSVLWMKSAGMHCEHLLDVLLHMQSTDSVISFNWDTIADFTIQGLDRPIYQGYLDLMNASPLRACDFRHRPVLLKLHGSLNWSVCSGPNCSLNGKPTLDIELRGGILARSCSACGNTSVESCIVPPTSQKLIRHGTLLHKLWLLARKKLADCHQLIFIGYSFPATDFYSEWLFRQIYFREANRPEIIVVNPDIVKKRSAVCRRYENLFRGCIIHRFETLEEFAKNGLHLLE